MMADEPEEANFLRAKLRDGREVKLTINGEPTRIPKGVIKLFDGILKTLEGKVAHV